MKESKCSLFLSHSLLTLLIAFLQCPFGSGQKVTGFTLIDTTTDQPIGPLVDGSVINLATVGSELSVRADTSGPIKSVIFGLDENQRVKEEKQAPYALNGDFNGDFKAEPVLSVTGLHTISATPTSESGTGTTATIVITIERSTAPSPTTSPIPTDVPAYNHAAAGALTGELKKWHKITLGFDGPFSTETATPNPFTDYALTVTFSHVPSGTTYNVPGYFAADGNAANSGATSGDVWLVHFAPDASGLWDWTAKFVQGSNVAQNGGGVSAGFMDGTVGSFTIGPTDKTGRDHRGKGRLQYVGEHHLRYAETGEWFLKAGADSPENFLSYEDFDNTSNINNRRKSWSPHQKDYNVGDPTWANGIGTEIIGAVNYLSEQGMNVFSFIPMNIDGDDKNVFPYVSDFLQDRLHLDVSKLAQWEVVFEHADHMGMYLHFKTQERENDHLLDGGNLGSERRLYYREMVARFGHHLALNWNIGEENMNTDAQRKEFADFFAAIDPYNHLVVVHTLPKQAEQIYSQLLGHPSYGGASVQTNPNNVYGETKDWVTRSAAAGQKWVVANDEQGRAFVGVVPDADDPKHDDIRKNVLWGNIMAGGGGVEYYFGYGFANSDLTCEDFRSRANMWAQSKYALEFFTQHVPFWTMSIANHLLSTGSAWCLANDDVFVIYLKNGGTTTIDLPTGHSYSVRWYDPRHGGDLQSTAVSILEGRQKQALGNAPNNGGKDWAVLIVRMVDASSASPSLSPRADLKTLSPTYYPTLYPRTSTVSPTFKLPSAPPALEPTLVPTAAPFVRFGAEVTGFVLVNADTNEDIGPLSDEGIINLRVLRTESLTVRAVVTGSVSAVVFGLDDNLSFQTERKAPYALGGDLAGSYRTVEALSVTGSHSISATPTSTIGAGVTVSIDVIVIDSPSGRVGGPPTVLPPLPLAPTNKPTTVTFAPTNAPTSAPTKSPQLPVTTASPTISSTAEVTPHVTMFQIMDAEINLPIMALEPGVIVTLSTLPTLELNVEAVTVPKSVGKVEFMWDSSFVRTEKVAPYALGGDFPPGNFELSKLLLETGTHILSALVYAEDGSFGGVFTTTFTIEA